MFASKRGQVNPLSATKIGVFFLKEKTMPNTLKHKNVYLDEFCVIFVIFSL